MISSEVLENICRIIANTETGLTGTEIRQILAESMLIDTDPTLTKWKRLFNAFANYQNKNRNSNNVLTFRPSLRTCVTFTCFKIFFIS